MKILFISQFAGSPYHGMVTRNYNWGIEMKRLGHDVSIVSSCYSHYRSKNPDKGTENQDIDGLQYFWLKGIKYNGKSALGRLKAIIHFQYQLFNFIRKNTVDYDLVIASSPQPFVIYPAHSIAKKCNAKLIYDIRDLWPLTLKEIGGMSKWHPLIMALQHAENYACKYANIVTAVPQNCKDYLVSRGMDAHKFLHIGNGHVVADNEPAPSLPEDHQLLLKTLHDKNKFIIGYAGTHGHANAMHIAIKATEKAHADIHFVCIGAGNEKNNLKQMVLEKKLSDRIHFLDPIHHSQIPEFLSKIDVSYIGSMNSPLYFYGASPAKINDYMLAEKPILYAIGDKNNPIEQSGCGICCEAENTDEIALAMDAFYDMDGKKLDDMGKHGKKWLVKNQLVSSQVKQILKALF